MSKQEFTEVVPEFCLPAPVHHHHHLHKAFDIADEDKNGYLTEQEFLNFISNMKTGEIEGLQAKECTLM